MLLHTTLGLLLVLAFSGADARLLGWFLLLQIDRRLPLQQNAALFC